MAETFTGENLQQINTNSIPNSAETSMDNSLTGIHDVVIDLSTLEREYYTNSKSSKYFENVKSSKTSLSKILDDFDELLEGMSISEKKDDKDKATKPKAVNKSMTLDNVIKYNDSVAAAAVLITTELTAIKNLLDTRLSKDGQQESPIKGIGKIFEGLGGGAAALVMLAGSLLIFAGAMILFQAVKWGPALAGLAMFALFTVGTLAIAKAVGSEQKTFREFTKGIMLMVGSYVLFAGALVLVSYIGKLIDWKVVLPTLGTFMVFVAATVVLGKFVSGEKSTFLQFTEGVLLMIASYAAFSGVLVLVSMIGQNIQWNHVMTTMVAFIGFVGISIILAKLAGSATADMLLLAAASAAMTLSFGLFTGALKLCSLIELQDVLNGAVVLGAMLVFIAATVALGAAIAAGSVVILTGLGLMVAVSAALLVMAASFAGALAMLSLINVTPDAIAKLESIKPILAAIAPLTPLAAAATVAIVPVTAFMVLFMAAVTALTAAIGLISLIKDSPEALQFKLSKISGAIETIAGMDLHPVQIAKALIGLPGVLLASTMMGTILAVFVGLSKLEYDEQAIFRVLGVVTLLVGTLSESGEAIKGMSIKSAEALTIALGGITTAMKNITDIITTIKDIPLTEIDAAVSNIQYMMSKLFMGSEDPANPTLVDVLESMPGISKRAARATETLPAVTTSLKNITDVIIQIKDVSPDMVAQAIESIKMEVACLKDCSGMFKEIAGESTTGHLWWKKDTFSEAGKSIDNISQLIPKIKGVFEQLGSSGFSTDGIDSLKIGVAAIGNIDKSFETGAEHLMKGFKDIDKIDGKSLTKIKANIDTINVSPLDKLGTSISSFITKASGLDTVVRNMENLSKALKDVSKQSDALKKFDFSKAAKAAAAKDSPSSAPIVSQASAEGKTDNEKIINLLIQNTNTMINVLNLMTGWDSNGLQVIPLIGEEEEKKGWTNQFFGIKK